MTAVTARFVARRNYDGAAVRDALDLALENPKLGWIDEIVGRINGEKGRANFFQIGPGIVIA